MVKFNVNQSKRDALESFRFYSAFLISYRFYAEKHENRDSTVLLRFARFNEV